MGGILVTGRAAKGRKNMGWRGGNRKEGRKEVEPFQHLPRSLHDMTTN